MNAPGFLQNFQQIFFVCRKRKKAGLNFKKHHTSKKINTALKKNILYILSGILLLVSACKKDTPQLPRQKDPDPDPIATRPFVPQQVGQSYHKPDTANPSIPQYLANVPSTYNADPTKKWPLMISLHGAGERGKDSIDIQKLERQDLNKTFRTKDLPCILISPQLISYYTAWQPNDLEKLLAEIKKHYNIDENKIILTGYSLGAHGVWDWGMANPANFSCIVPIAGWADKTNAAKLKNTYVWAFHNKKDTAVKLAGSQDMINAIKAAGGKKAIITVYDAAGHNAWSRTYTNVDVMDWMLAQKK